MLLLGRVVTPTILVLKRLRQEHHKFTATLGYIQSSKLDRTIYCQGLVFKKKKKIKIYIKLYKVINKCCKISDGPSKWPRGWAE